MPVQFRDFVPKMLAAPKLFKAGDYETMHAALAAANQWIEEDDIRVLNIETVVLPNILEPLRGRHDRRRVGDQR